MKNVSFVARTPEGKPMGGQTQTSPGAAARTALLWALILNGSFLVIEAWVGFLTGSLALLSDAAHMVGDVGAVTLALGAAHLARRPATPERSYGFARAEILGAFVNALALLAACALIFKTAIERLLVGAPPVEAQPVLLVGVAGLVVNLGSAWVLYRAEDGNLNVRGALIHMLADALGSVGAIVAAVLLSRGIYAADAVVSVVIGLLVLWTTWGLLRDSTRILLQFAPTGIEVKDVREALASMHGIADVHDLHVWTLDGLNVILTTHLVTKEGASPDAVRTHAERMLRERFGIDHTTIQSEAIGSCTHPGCPLLDQPARERRHGHRH
jgi:cobalt-zinc-cadmium efflux system protein